jgi:hypothetical protein
MALFLNQMELQHMLAQGNSKTSLNKGRLIQPLFYLGAGSSPFIATGQIAPGG